MLGPGSFASPALTELSVHGLAFFQHYWNSFLQRGLDNLFASSSIFLKQGLRASLVAG